MVKINGKYLISGRYVKVVGVTDTHIQVVWGYNGQSPIRQCDRYIPISSGNRFVEV
jgi:hypothetical protein